MKPLIIETAARSIVGWIFDFKNDFNRLPNSLEDLADNKAEKHTYNPKKAFELNEKYGFNTKLKILEDGFFELTVSNNEKSILFSSNSGKYTIGNVQ